MAVEVLSVSSKGQVVLPMEMRKKMSIENGSKLAAYSIGDMIMLKPISVPSEQDFKESLKNPLKLYCLASADSGIVDLYVKRLK